MSGVVTGTGQWEGRGVDVAGQDWVWDGRVVTLGSGCIWFCSVPTGWVWRVSLVEVSVILLICFHSLFHPERVTLALRAK
jgi:hypothetical protein